MIAPILATVESVSKSIMGGGGRGASRWTFFSQAELGEWIGEKQVISFQQFRPEVRLREAEAAGPRLPGGSRAGGRS